MFLAMFRPLFGVKTHNAINFNIFHRLYRCRDPKELVSKPSSHARPAIEGSASVQSSTSRRPSGSSMYIRMSHAVPVSYKIHIGLGTSYYNIYSTAIHIMRRIAEQTSNRTTYSHSCYAAFSRWLLKHSHTSKAPIRGYLAGAFSAASRHASGYAPGSIPRRRAPESASDSNAPFLGAVSDFETWAWVEVPLSHLDHFLMCGSRGSGDLYPCRTSWGHAAGRTTWRTSPPRCGSSILALQARQGSWHLISILYINSMLTRGY